MKKTEKVLLSLAFGLAAFVPALKADSLPPYDNLATSQMGFGLQFFQEILKQNPGKNILVSPYSAASALGMVYNGAGGKTQAGMAKAMRLEALKTEEVNRENLAMQQALQNADPKTELLIANSLWTNKKFTIKESFLKTNQTYYQSEVSSLDFDKGESTDTINRWVSDHTKGRIPAIIDSLKRDDAMVLVNAVYFKGLWQIPFNKENTHSWPFHMEDGSSPDRTFMSLENNFLYLKTKDFQAINLPYGNGRLSLLVFVPHKMKLSKFCKELSSKNLNHWIDQFQSREVSLELPKFKIEFETGLAPALTQMGMGAAFDMERADFSRITPDPLYISQAVQKTFIQVDETGTEAAAATALKFHVYADGGGSAETMTVNHPFFIALVDNQTKALLFTGAIQDPQFSE